MGFFRSSKSHLEQLEADCQSVAQLSAQARHRCDESLRGKHEYMAPEQRADLVREALVLSKKAQAHLVSAKEKQAAMESDQCPTEDLLAAESRIVASQLEVNHSIQALKEARESLLEGIPEIEQFYGPRSSEAKHLRKVLADLEAAD